MQPETLTLVDHVCSGLVRAASAVRTDTDAAVATNDHIEVIKHYDHLRKVTAQIKEAREALTQMEEQLSREIVPEFMKNAGVKTVTIEGIGRVTVSHRYSCFMPDKEKGIDWLKGNGHGGIVQETVNSSTLAAFSKSLLEDEGKELPDDIFKVGTSPFTSITKVKS